MGQSPGKPCSFGDGLYTPWLCMDLLVMFCQSSTNSHVHKQSTRPLPHSILDIHTNYLRNPTLEEDDGDNTQHHHHPGSVPAQVSQDEPSPSLFWCEYRCHVAVSNMATRWWKTRHKHCTVHTWLTPISSPSSSLDQNRNHIPPTLMICVARGWMWRCAKCETRIKCLGKNPKTPNTHSLTHTHTHTITILVQEFGAFDIEKYHLCSQKSQ